MMCGAYFNDRNERTKWQGKWYTVFKLNKKMMYTYIELPLRWAAIIR